MKLTKWMLKGHVMHDRTLCCIFKFTAYKNYLTDRRQILWANLPTIISCDLSHCCSLTLIKTSCKPIYPSYSLCMMLLRCITIWKAVSSQVSMEGNIQSTYSDPTAFTEFFLTETTKALQETQGLSSVLRWVYPPPLSPGFPSCGSLNWYKEAM